MRTTECSNCGGTNDHIPQAYCSTCRAAYNRTRRRPLGLTRTLTERDLIAKGPRWPAAYPPRLADVPREAMEEKRDEIST